MPRKKDGTFAPGASGNPGGRPRAPVRFRELYDANDDDEKNYRRLVHWRDQNEDGKLSLRAIELLLERRYGRAASADEDEMNRAKLEMLKAGKDPDASQLMVVMPGFASKTDEK